MENFIFKNETKIIFGRGTENDAGKDILKYGRRVLFHYGGGSIKKSGLYEKIMKSLKNNGLTIFELGGVKPNPFVSLIREGIKICRENDIDFILAVGGGSVIDSAKGISMGVNYKGDIWDFFEGKAKLESAVPIGVIVTIPAAGSESSVVTVITNEDGLIKRGFHSSMLLPKFAILNPELTFTLPVFQVACGAADILAHTFERYFTQSKNVDLTDRLCEGLMKSVIKNSKIAISDQGNYDAMAELMWASTIAHNGILGTGRIEDWASHKFGHELSALYGITHGASLAVMFPAWMKYVYKYNIERFAQFAARAFNIDTDFNDEERLALMGIKEIENYFKEIGLPTTLKELNVSSENFELMAQKAVAKGPIGNFIKISKEDAVKIYELAQ
ncbi:MAG: iron-containing alcohol dehydrogenase [Actinobacteria bacterium]|nr:iron-containing alcohol dehydrogenase [Actinomycetota bacterium]